MELKEYYEAKERAEKSLKEFLEKQPKIDNTNIEPFDKLVHSIKSLCTIIKCEEEKMRGGSSEYGAGGYSGNYGDGGYSRSMARMNDPYSNTQPWYGAGNGGGSNIEHLEAAMRMTTDPATRENLRMMIERERMNHNR